MDTKNFGTDQVRLPGDSSPAARASETMNEIKQEVGKYVDRAHDYVDRAKEQAADLKDEAKDRVDEFVTDAKAQGQKMKRQAEDQCQTIDEYAHENPWQVAAIAAGIGAVVAVLLCKSTRND